MPVALVPLLWMGLNLVRSAGSVYGGWLADRYGRLRVLRGGWLCYALVYAGFGFATAVWQVVALFGLYAIFYALTEGAERALVADFAPPNQRGASVWAVPLRCWHRRATRQRAVRLAMAAVRRAGGVPDGGGAGVRCRADAQRTESVAERDPPSVATVICTLTAPLPGKVETGNWAERAPAGT
jgi:hypothetical protein